MMQEFKFPEGIQFGNSFDLLNKTNDGDVSDYMLSKYSINI